MTKHSRVSRKEAPKRRQEIVSWLKAEATVTYEQIQQRFSVSPMTARRDVAALETEGKVARTLGGVMRLSEGLLSEGPLYLRQKRNLDAKRAIARTAAGLIAPGNTLFLDAGTTCIELARVIAQSQLNVTIVTNSILVSACFCEGLNHAKVIQIGGAVNPSGGCSTGADTEAAAKSYYIDLGFFSAVGYVPGDGTYESFADMFRVKQAVTEHCAQAILLVDHSKFGQRALNRVFPDAKFSRIITDRAIPGLKDPRLMLAH